MDCTFWSKLSRPSRVYLEVMIHCSNSDYLMYKNQIKINLFFFIRREGGFFIDSLYIMYTQCVLQICVCIRRHC